MVAWILSFIFVALFFYFMKDVIQLLLSGIGFFLLLGIYFLGVEVFFTITTILFFVMFGPTILDNLTGKRESK